MRRFRWGATGCLLSAACAPPPPPQRAPIPRERAATPLSRPAATPPAPLRASSDRVGETPPESVERAPASDRVELELELTRVLDVPVTSLALGEGTRVAVLSTAPFAGDAHALRELPLPAAFRAKPGEVDRLQIFFGRDNEPRIMGGRRSAGIDEPIYWRHLPGGWRDGKEELGRLASRGNGALWGVLGAADPELVCRVNAVCIIKRASGWTLVPAGPNERRTRRQGQVLWGLDASGLARLEPQGWQPAFSGVESNIRDPAIPRFDEATAFWADLAEAWVATPRALFHYRAGTWSELSSPVGGVASFWGTSADSVWLAGSRGAAHFDGRRFRMLALSGPLRVVLGRSDGDVWFGGDSGLYRAQPVP